MRYGLVCLTHGDPTFLERTVTSFREMVAPEPTKALLLHDGPPADVRCWSGLRESTGFRPIGFCRATAQAWNAARQWEVEYVFWLEHDFLFRRPVDLRPMARALEQYQLAQMSLVRNACNEAERAAGGLVESWPFEYTLHHEMDAQDPFLLHQGYWTTNPSLIPRWVLEDYEIPAGPECEGRLGALMREHGLWFGAWGSGESWVEHIGVRTGGGY